MSTLSFDKEKIWQMAQGLSSRAESNGQLDIANATYILGEAIWGSHRSGVKDIKELGLFYYRSKKPEYTELIAACRRCGRCTKPLQPLHKIEHMVLLQRIFEQYYGDEHEYQEVGKKRPSEYDS